MTDNNDDKTLNAPAKKTLTLKPGGMNQGTVRQDMGRGRTNAVVVETRKRRPMRPEDEKQVHSAAAPAPKPAAPAAAAPRPQAPQPRIHQPSNQQQRPGSSPSQQQRPGSSAPQQRQPERPRGNVLHDLSAGEMEARRRALMEAQARDVIEAKQRAEEEARRKVEEERRIAAEKEEAARRAAEEAEAAKLAASQPAAEAKSEPAAEKPVSAAQPAPRAEARPQPAAAPARPATETAAPRGRRTDGDEEDDRGARRGNLPVRGKVAAPAPAKPAARLKTEEERRRGKLTVTSSNLDEDGTPRGRSMASMRRRQEKFRRSQMQETREKVMREVILPETITIQELSQRMSERAVDVIKFLMKEGQMMKPGDVIDADLAELIAVEFGHTVKRVSESDVEEGIFNQADDEGEMLPRPPVVTIMGHVDHGKTSLLDAIRQANVVAGEAGGITQHIGAYQVEKNGQKITFIDTPGHAAFTAMRARGAQATDIAVLVVAADDSVMPQTIESINHAKAAGVPIVVAINKIDKHEANPEKVRQQLLQHEVFVESMGGEVLDVEVSAKNKLNLDKLLEAILLQAEILDLKADPNRTAEGTVIEAELDRGRGAVATVLVQKGTLKPGQIIVAGDQWGRVRALVNDKGEHVKEAGPAMPVEILGLSGTPSAGDRFAVVENESRAREISEYRQRLARDKAVARQTGQRGSLEQMMSQLQTSGMKEFPLVIKADVQGSVEAIIASLDKLGTDEVRARIVHSGAGAITESDISLAEASNAAIIGFNVRANAQARTASERAGIEIRYYNIIYDLVDDVKAAMSGLLSPERRETFLGNAEILEVFNITKVGKVAGCRVVEGKVERGAGVRLVRDNVVIHEGKLKTLKRFKDEVNEVPVGQECGMAFENYEDIRAGDTIECFRVEHITRTL
ncbi:MULTISPECIES: translation initiation factor IF-2 [Rhizobium/Agrobacterium group]|jgi:translation initiation factor IF-2|uniref:Translation initiation factor IF-2 n=4 Tax=Agrobacterium pusense TaxID=648995 RepID=A0A6H0ZPW1_9HYPH|nr:MULTISPECIES: translation initiation factor IF-2 [Rhizobium/Agrobacterium group]ANV24090.1 translation initiation factor IF-2 [Rhizobium sp. S41]AUC10869.1 translation initiation factor IF-2 [Rhizobium sp. Y9]KGE84341.1 translation initiation factor IF-2 [Rhizobium sp. H41]KIV61905.1 Translation initiation factor 2 [Rhizobium sp. UR51a]MDP9774880.1 translation initiation factor IF-2 [Rhizobium sp. SORGH_AS_0755]OAI91010.1 translation initiation factor IF-2 [Rhizobium sp. GHKF11]TGR69107.1